MLATGNRPQPSILPANVQASRIGLPPIERSVFKRPVTRTQTMDAQWLYPVYCQPALPGDVWKADLDVFIRMMTLLRPIFGNVYLDLFAFYCPNRVVWPNWVKLQGQQDNPGDSTDYLVPHVYANDSGGWVPTLGSIYDYFVLPVGDPFYQTSVAQTRFISALPLRMYNLTYRDWFADQDFTLSPPIWTNDGPDDYRDYALLPRLKRQDYFTTARPWPQKGPAVEIPIASSTAPVVGNEQIVNFVRGTSGAGGFGLGVNTGTTYLAGGYTAGVQSGPVGSAFSSSNPASTVYIGLHPSPNYSGMVADLSGAYATSINTIRDAVTLQQMFELDARGGTRYTESLFTRWRTVVTDDRLQRPEYIGGFSQRLDVSAVPQTSQNAEGNPIGQLGGYGVGGRSGHQMSYSVPEHGYIYILANIRADLTYSQQLDQHWTLRSRFDFPEPLTMHIGEQPILASEMVYDSSPSMDLVWGYQEAWASWRYSKNEVCHLMRPNVSGSLATWNLALGANDVPYQLDDEWLRDNPPIDRVIAVPSEPAFILDMTTTAYWSRAMPVYSTPGLPRF